MIRTTGAHTMRFLFKRSMILTMLVLTLAGASLAAESVAPFNGKDLTDVGDMAAIYGVKAPTNPTYKKPGEWQTLKIEFLAPRFDADGKKTSNAKFVKVELNGSVVQSDVEVLGPTGSQLSDDEK